jgi:glycerophosphoryl diester phosphodiesterase
MTSSSPFVVAHRAGNDLRHALEAAAQGARLVEADVQLHRGRLEVRHLKTLRPLPILWDRWRLVSAFRERLLLPDVLALAPDVPLMLDLKGDDTRLVPLLLAQLGERPATVCSRSWRLLDLLEGRPGITVVHSAGTRRELREMLRRAEAGRLAGVSVHERLVDASSSTLLRAAAAVVMTWPVNTAERARELVALGVDGLISDRPELIRDALAALPRPAAA